MYQNLTREELIDALADLNRRYLEVERKTHDMRDEIEWLEGAIRRRTRELSERVKELNCIYGLSEILDRRDMSLEVLLQKAVEMLPQALQFPGRACARLEISGREFRTPGFDAPPWKLSEKIFAFGQPMGTVEVGYVRAESKADPFLREERSLVVEVAKRLGDIIELKGTELSFMSFRDRIAQLSAPVAMCSCGRVRAGRRAWQAAQDFLRDLLKGDLTSDVCSDCRSRRGIGKD